MHELDELRLKKQKIAIARTYDFYVKLKAHFPHDWNMDGFTKMSWWELERWEGIVKLNLRFVIADYPKLKRLLDRAIEAKRDAVSQ